MKVYLVFLRVEWDGDYFKGVFYTEAGAQKFIKGSDKPTWCDAKYFIKEVEVQ